MWFIVSCLHGDRGRSARDGSAANHADRLDRDECGRQPRLTRQPVDRGEGLLSTQHDAEWGHLLVVVRGLIERGEHQLSADPAGCRGWGHRQRSRSEDGPPGGNLTGDIETGLRGPAGEGHAGGERCTGADSGHWLTVVVVVPGEDDEGVHRLRRCLGVQLDGERTFRCRDGRRVEVTGLDAHGGWRGERGRARRGTIFGRTARRSVKRGSRGHRSRGDTGGGQCG